MGKETVLLYCMEKEKENAVRHVCLQLGIKARHIHSVQYQLPIGMLLLLKETTPKTASHMFPEQPLTATNTLGISEEMMVMDGFSAASMDRFLNRIKKSGIADIALKAVVTEFNRNWNSMQLYHELKAEQIKLQ